MKTTIQLTLALLVILAHPTFAADPLPSWNDTAPKQAIVAFVEKVTKPGSADFVPVPERIATFDNEPVQLFAGLRYYLDAPDGGPEWGLRLGLTFLFPKS